MDELKIIIPSRGRAECVNTLKIVKNPILVVPFLEYDKYKEYNPDVEIIQRPKDVMGISRVRQYIIETFEEPFMLDDDIEYVQKFYTEAGEPYKITDGEHVRKIIEHTKHIAEQLNSKLYGFTNTKNPLLFNCGAPFSFNKFICASMCGYLKGHNLKHNYDIVSADDYWINSLNIFKNRYSFRNDLYGFMSKNFVNNGGLQDVRTIANIKNDTLILKEYFGDVVNIKYPSGTRNKINEGERSITYPF